MALKPQDIERVGRMLSQNYGIRVVCEGTRCCTDGKTIYLPALPKHIDNPRLLALMRSYLDHEVGHLVGKSDSDLKYDVHNKHGDAGGYVLNALEDVRIEQIMSDLWAGCEANLRTGVTEVFKRLEQRAADGGPDAEALQKPLKQLTTALYAKGKGFDVPAWIDPQIGQLVEAVEAKHQLTGIGRWAKQTRDLLPVVEDIMAMIQSQQQCEGDGDGEQQQGEGQEGQSQAAAGAGGQGQPQGQQEAGESDQAEGQQAAEGQSEGQPGDEDGEGQSEAEKAEGEPESQQQDAAGQQGDQAGGQSEAPGPEGQSGEDASSQPQSASGGDGAGGERPFSPADPAEAGDGVDMGAELAEAAEGELDRAVSEATDAVSVLREYEPGMDKFHQAVPYDDPVFVDQARQAGGPMRQRLAQLLQSEDRVWWRSGRRRGTPDPRSMAQLATGVSSNVLRQRFEHRSPNTACYLMIDGSGSMGDGEMRMACLAASAFAQVLDLCKHPCKVEAFVGQHPAEGLSRQDRDDLDRPALRRPSMAQGVRYLGIDYAVAKEWHEPFHRARTRMAWLARQHGGGTPLGEAVLHATDELLARRERRRVLMAFTDGVPDDGRLLRDACKFAERHGVETVLIGIETDAPSRFHHRHAICQSIEQLSTTTMAELAKALGH